MKNKIKYIITFIMGGIVFSTICVIGSNVISANQVGINSSKTTKTNIQDAIDELYGKAEEYSGCSKGLDCSIKNGTIIYYNVDTGTTCTNYTEAQSVTDVKSGCMKFYVFNEDKNSNTVNLILDHNTTGAINWNSNGDNRGGPITVLNKLKEDTNNWVGTIQPSNYTGKTIDGTYTINYNEYKARLITAAEVAQITGNTGWTVSSNYFYFDSNLTTLSPTCKNTNKTGCKYGWLGDRTTTNCLPYCLNKGVLGTASYGNLQYWTADSSVYNTNHAWYVSYVGIYDKDDGGGDAAVINNNYWVGVRPVITVTKSQLGL